MAAAEDHTRMETHETQRDVSAVPDVAATADAVEALGVDAVVAPCFDTDTFDDEPALAAAVGRELARARERGLFTGATGQVLTITPSGGWAGGRVVLVGAGARGAWSPDVARRVATAGGLAVRAQRFARAGVLDRADAAEGPARVAQAIAEGVTLANFDPGVHKTSGPAPSWLTHVRVRTVLAAAEAGEALARGVVLGRFTNLARELANAPANTMTPRVLAGRAEAVAAETGLRVEVLDETAIAGHRMGLFQAVAQGSVEPPRLIVLRHDPPGAPESPVLGLIGKGITFDTGGISLKQPEKMERMKDDMSGGAAVIAAMGAMAVLGAPVRVIGVVPACENMPGGRAVKPGDVMTSAEGITVEMINTDAEGRLVLGDGLWYARQQGATHLVDVATLTGSCVVALGHTTTGLFGQPDAWVGQVLAASARAGERTWAMPTHADYRDLLRSDVADMVNSASRAAGAISAAWFIGAFAGDRPWAHLDIAGTAWAEDAAPHQPKGATGAAVRTLAELALNPSAWGGTAGA
jgi:leucyl aminopeptidase